MRRDAGSTVWGVNHAPQQQARQFLPLLRTTLPIVALVAGVGLIGVAVVLLVTGRTEKEQG